MSEITGPDPPQTEIQPVPPTRRGCSPFGRAANLTGVVKENLFTTLLLLGLVTILLINEWLAGDAIAAIRSRWREWFPAGPTVVLAVFPNSTVSRPMIDGLGFTNNEERVTLSGDVMLERFNERDTLDATAKALKERLSKGDVVLVLGHERSTTVAFLNEHVYEAADMGETPMPLILPAVTNPNITQSQRGDESHILRLPANDADQVELLRQMLVAFDAQAVCLLVDTSNINYSGYIAKELVAKAPMLPVIDSVGIGLAGSGFEPQRLLNGSADTVVFVGMEVEASIFLKRLRREAERAQQEALRAHRDALRTQRDIPADQAEWRPTPSRLVFTDGVAGDVFENVARGAASPHRVIVTGPFPTSSAKDALLDTFPTYRPYATAAKSIAADLLNETRNGGRITRRSVLATLRRWVKDGKTRSYGDIAVKFDGRGDNVIGQVHAFEITKKGTTHAGDCTCK